MSPKTKKMVDSNVKAILICDSLFKEPNAGFEWFASQQFATYIWKHNPIFMVLPNYETW